MTPLMRASRTIALCLGIVFSCRDATPQVMHFIHPSETDAAITNFNAFHTALNSTGGPPRNRLLVFLPGTGASPAQYQDVSRTAASNGLHSIGLQYVNGDTVASLCRDDPDTNCHAQVREEIICGTNTSSLIDVDVTNSIIYRLDALLRYLTNQYPTEAWQAFVDENGHVLWSNVVIAGHSQGASHAAFIAKSKTVSRAVLFGNEADWVTGLGAAPWFSRPSSTPTYRYLAFTHEQDLVASQFASWDAMSISGVAINVESSQGAPFDGSHRLVTDLAPAVGTNWLAYHSAPVVDLFTPRTNGDPVLRYAWEWLLAGPVVWPSLSLAATNADITLHFSAERDSRYAVQTSSNLIGSWQPSQLVVTNSTGAIELTLTNAGQHMFFRLSVQ